MIILEWARFILASLLMLAGLLSIMATTVGLFRFHYILNRIHVAAKCDTFGVMLTFLSLKLIFGLDAASLKLLLIMIFVWIANPVSSHLVAHMEAATNPHLDEECEVMHLDAD